MKVKPLSFMKDGLRSLYRSGAYFTGSVVPKLLEKAGVPHGSASKTGRALGTAAGIASVVVGLGFLAAIPVSMPMFLVATGMLPVKGSIAALAATALLGGTGTVVTLAGLGMCREAARHLHGAAGKVFGKVNKFLDRKTPHRQPVPENSSFNARRSAKADFTAATAPENKVPIAMPASVPVSKPAGP